MLDYKFFIQLPPTLTKLCHIKRDYLVHMLKMSTIGRNARNAYRRLWNSLTALLIVVCGKLSQICCSILLSLDGLWLWLKLWNAWSIAPHT